MRTDGFVPLRAGLARWPGLDARTFDACDEGRALPTVHHVISNFKAYVLGTCHGVSRRWLQGYMDEFDWRYAHRHDRSAVESLVGTMLGFRRTTRDIASYFEPQEGSPSRRRE